MEKKFKDLSDFLMKSKCNVFYRSFNLVSRFELENSFSDLFPASDYVFIETSSNNCSLYFYNRNNDSLIIAKPRAFRFGV